MLISFGVTEICSTQNLGIKNKWAQRGHSPEEKVKGHSGAIYIFIRTTYCCTANIKTHVDFYRIYKSM